jgi:hypothetical protein
MLKVASSMINSVKTSIDRRPTRSPKWPKTIPPMGRATNPTAKVPNAARVPTSGSKVGKNSLLKTSAELVPYRKKSYHSVVVPMKLASATCPLDVRRSGTIPSLAAAPWLIRPSHPNASE